MRVQKKEFVCKRGRWYEKSKYGLLLDRGTTIPKEEEQYRKEKKSTSKPAQHYKVKKLPNIEILTDITYKSNESPQHQILEQTAKEYFRTTYACVIIEDHVSYPDIYVAADFMVRRHGYRGCKKNLLRGRYLFVECLTTYSLSPEIIERKRKLDIENKLIFVVPHYDWVYKLFNTSDKVIYVEVDLIDNKGRVKNTEMGKYVGYLQFECDWVSARITQSLNQIEL